jgi:hypothetical protein
VYLPAGDRAGIERLIGYMTRCPFSLSRLVKVTKTGQVVYKALCGGPHNAFYVAHSVMWRSSFLCRYFSVSSMFYAT